MKGKDRKFNTHMVLHHILQHTLFAELSSRNAFSCEVLKRYHVTVTKHILLNISHMIYLL